MARKRYSIIVGIVAAMFMMYTMYTSVNLSDAWFIVAGVFAVLAFCFSAVAVISALKGSDFLLDIATGVASVISIYTYLVLIINQDYFEGIMGLLEAIGIGVFYYVGKVYKTEVWSKQYLFDLCSVLVISLLMALDSNTTVFFFIAILFALSSFMVYSFIATSRSVWMGIVIAAGITVLILATYNFVAGSGGFIALAGACYTGIYFVISLARPDLL